MELSYQMYILVIHDKLFIHSCYIDILSQPVKELLTPSSPLLGFLVVDGFGGDILLVISKAAVYCIWLMVVRSMLSVDVFLLSCPRS